MKYACGKCDRLFEEAELVEPAPGKALICPECAEFLKPFLKTTAPTAAAPPAAPPVQPMKQELPKFKLRGYSFTTTITLSDAGSGLANLNIHLHAPGAPDALMQAVSRFMGYLFNIEHGVSTFIAASASAKEKMFLEYEYTEKSEEEEDSVLFEVRTTPPPFKCERCGAPSYAPRCDDCAEKERLKREKLTSIPVSCARCEKATLPVELVDSKEVGAAICLDCLRVIQPATKSWQREPITEKQSSLLLEKGMRPEFVTKLTKGEASGYIGQIMKEEEGR